MLDSAQSEDLRVGQDPATGTLGLEDGCLEEERSVTILESGDRVSILRS